MKATLELEADYDGDLAQEDFDGDYGELFDVEDFAALGIDPSRPTPAKPGSEDKVMMLAARYAAGLPLWHNQDCYDHGPALAFVEGGGEEDEEFED